MQEIIESLDKAFLLLSKIPVAGESVDLLAMARQELRTAYKLLKEKKEETNGG